VRHTIQETYTETRTVVTRYTCDWCGCDSPDPNPYLKDMGTGHRFEFELSYLTGYTSSAGTTLVGWKVEDLCLPCAEKLRKLLEGAGITVIPYEVSF